jgi:DNA-directed RNA polymerase subunit alpha
MEDITELVLNVKKLIIRMQSDEPKVMTVSADKAGEVKAENIAADPSIRIINTDLVLATLTKDVKFEMEMIVENGRGYSPAYERVIDLDRFNQEIGRVMVDAIYSPVVRVRYRTEDTRVGQRTNYDRLILEVWTNGTISPEMALVEAAKIMRKHINPFVQYFELGEETVEEELVAESAEEDGIDEELISKLNMPIEELELSVRAGNCLDSIKIRTVGELVTMTEADLLKIRSFGKTSLREIKRKLADIGGLSLGMTDLPQVKVNTD